MRRKLSQATIGLFLLLQSAGAVTLQQAFTATAPSDAACNPGPSASTFLTTDSTIYLYVLVASATAGDRLRIDWVRPDGVVYGSGSFPSLPSGGSFCFDDGIDVAGATAAQYPGVWTIRGYWNSAAFFTRNFTLNAAGGGNTLSVLSTSNLFLSGHTGTQGISGPGTTPPQISVSGSGGKAVRFTNVTGAWTCLTGGANNGPDGATCAGSSTNVGSFKGIAGLTHSSRTMFLAGVFLDANETADPAPARLDVSNYNATATLQPGLGQTFFIGDGLSASNTLQEFIVPVGATRLFLGIVDGSGFQGNPCCWDDNSGSMSVTWEVVTPTGGGGGGGGGTCSYASATNLVGNGSFELPGGATTIFLGSGTSNATLLPCWTVTSGSVDYVGTLWPASDGANSLDMAGASGGTIAQTIATTAGSQYTVSFDLAANPSGGTQIKTLQVSAAGQSQNYTVNPSVNPASSTGWLRGRTFTFTANSASTILQFASLDGATSYGPALDNVCAIGGTSPCTGAGGGGGGGGGGSTVLSISLAPSTGTSASGTQHTVTATVVNQSNVPQANVAVTFTILSGPNQGVTGVCGPTTCKTGANGQVTFTYTGTRGAGVDSITACIDTGTAAISDCCTERGIDQPGKLLSPRLSAVAPASRRTATRSTNVVIVGAATVDATCASGANRVGNGGCFPITGAATELGAFTFAGLAPAAVTTASLAAYDTVVLNLGASGLSCDMTKLPAQAKTALVTFVGGGKKLIIYDSECKASGTNQGLDYSWLPYPFTTANPGALGAQGTLNIVENSTLGSAITGSPYYIDAANLSNNTDAVGDMNVMTTKDPHWCLAMSGTNALKVTGPVHAYAKYPGGTDSGLFIYNGLDMDELNNVGNANLRKLWYLELLQAFNPSGLPCGVAVVGITTSITTSSPAVGSQVTVTARVVDQLGQAQANVPVTFTITGINATGAVVCNPSTCRTDANGQVTFTYSGTGGSGTDSVQACFTPSSATAAVCATPIAVTWGQGGGGPACATPVTKTWTAGGLTCNYFVQPLTNVGVPAAGTRNGFLQIFTGLQCKWGAVSNDPWITIIAGASGTGSPGAVSYSVAPNTTSSPRTGTISITDGSGVVQTHTVIQLPGGPPCSFGLSPLSGSAPAGGGGGAFLLTTGSGCYWIAIPNDPWVHVTPNSGYGSQLLNYTGDANPTTSSRSGSIGVMGQTFTVFQGAPAPAVTPGTPLISEGGIVNAASSRGGPLARGSFFTIYGTDIGPTVPSQATSYPLPDTMGGVVVTISQGSVSRRAILHFVSSTQVNGIIPSNAPLGDVQVTVTFNGTVGISSSATLVDTSFGIFSAASGIGPGIIQNWNSPTDVVLNLPTIPAKPQQLGILWGTGLGPVSTPDNNKPPVGDLTAPVIVEIAGINAQVIYHGRAPDFAGVDNIYFYVPQNVPEGCSVPVRIKAGPSWSNTVRMAIRGSAGNCVASPTSSLTTTGGKVGAVVLMRAELNGQFQANQPPANVTLDLGAAIFAEIKAGGQLAFSGVLNLPPAGSCASNTKGIDFTSLLGGGHRRWFGHYRQPAVGCGF